MNVLIDRTRWPVLVTYSDIGQGHTGHVYKCSGWEKVGEPERRCPLGRRRSREGRRSVDARARSPLSCDLST
jgi:hypothetical protein